MSTEFGRRTNCYSFCTFLRSHQVSGGLTDNCQEDSAILPDRMIESLLQLQTCPGLRRASPLRFWLLTCSRNLACKTPVLFGLVYLFRTNYYTKVVQPLFSATERLHLRPALQGASVQYVVRTRVTGPARIKKHCHHEPAVGPQMRNYSRAGSLAPQYGAVGSECRDGNGQIHSQLSMGF